jgi:glycosyltransferase involved in cell wall biosynthesis
MKQLLIISSAPLIVKEDGYFTYSPYGKEMQIWAKYSDEIQFCCPIWNEDKGLLNSEIGFKIHKVIPLKEFDIKTVPNAIKSIYYSIVNCFIIFKAIKKADHIHLRCPGNVALLAAFIQVFFPQKMKTAKYAGNWDPQAKQPRSYRLQKWILSNTFFTKNMQVLIYGEWPNQTKNIKPFFTASYTEADKGPLVKKRLEDKIGFLFVGTLVKGKNPMYAIQLVEVLQNKGYGACLNLYGEGIERNRLEKYIEINKLERSIVLKGNQPKETIKKAYQRSHFVVLPSGSEGWPKAIAEGMFWGCVPVATAVSCVPFMLDYGNRGILLNMGLEKDALQVEAILNDQLIFDSMQEEGSAWSRKYTVDVFEEEIKKSLHP